MSKSLDPTPILKLALGFQPSRVVLSAVDLGLFTLLHIEGPMTGEAVGQRLALHGRGLYDFLDTLVCLQVLSREGAPGPTAQYANGPDANTFLSEHSPHNVVGFLSLRSNLSYTCFAGLTNTLRTGRAPIDGDPATAAASRYFFDNIYHDDTSTARFLAAMASMNGPAHRTFARAFDFSARKYRTLLDVGGALGHLSCEVAKAQPEMRCTTLDLPVVEQAAKEYVRKEEVADRVTVVTGDFFKDDFPNADVITMGKVLHDHPLPDKLKLMRKAFAALPPGGVLVAIEYLIDDDRRKHLDALIMSLVILTETSAGFDFTAADFQRWATDVGFSSTDTMDIGYPQFAAIAYK